MDASSGEKKKELHTSERLRSHPRREGSVSMFSDSDIDWEELKLAFTHPVTGVEIRERKKKLGKNKKCFSGNFNRNSVLSKFLHHLRG